MLDLYVDLIMKRATLHGNRKMVYITYKGMPFTLTTRESFGELEVVSATFGGVGSSDEDMTTNCAFCSKSHAHGDACKCEIYGDVLLALRRKIYAYERG
jgi:hypothetical protein